MKLRFQVEYRTTFGEELVLNVVRADGSQKADRHKMQTADKCIWRCEISKAQKAGTVVRYYYSLWRAGKEVRTEWLVVPHCLELAALRGTSYTAYDHWIDIPEDAHMYSTAFTDCVMARECQPSEATEYRRTVRLKVRSPQLRADEWLAVAGQPECLGSWDPRKAVPMAEHEYHEWVVSLDAAQLPRDGFEFKFIVLSSKHHQEMWEHSMNRYIALPAIADGEVVVYELPQAEFSIYPWRGAGTLVPVFSLRSEGSFGVGDFGDLKLMAEWVAKTGQHVLQILPINDTIMTGTWQDSYPYNSISIYALHPQYADFRQMPPLKDESLRRHFESLRQELNALPQIDYERMIAAKMDYLRRLYEQEWARLRSQQDFKKFFDGNSHWLQSYAAYCMYRDKYSTPDFTQWPQEATLAAALQRPSAQTRHEMNFWYFVQYHLDRQMRAAHEHARKHKVILKGDIPIGISRDGVEAWVEPRYFNMNGQTGAPPDQFSADGQNWGFPTYNWDVMLADGCQWWQRRFRKMAEYFDAYRIDHVLGFFRIWEIPVPQKSGLEGQFVPALGLSREEIESYGIKGHDDLFLPDHKRRDRWHPRIAVQFQEPYERLTEGEKYNFNRLYDDYFYHRNNQFWYQEAMKKLPRLTQATRMLCCAEDLGMVPDCVAWVMNELKILSLEIQSMPKEPMVRFGHLSHNPYRSVCTITNHDMPTLRQWWDEDYERTQDYFSTMLYHNEQAPHPLPGWLAKEIISRHLTSPSMLCLISLQDWLAVSEQLRLPDANGERINIPANPRHYWRYRMHLTIEQLLQADELNDTLKTLVSQSGR